MGEVEIANTSGGVVAVSVSESSVDDIRRLDKGYRALLDAVAIAKSALKWYGRGFSRTPGKSMNDENLADLGKLARQTLKDIEEIRIRSKQNEP